MASVGGQVPALGEFSSMRPEHSGGSFRVPEIGDVIAGKYRVEAVVGTGGMGIVLSALHLRLRQSVAIKVLTMAGVGEGRRQEAQARFLREAQAAATLTSDHVVRVFDVGTLDNGVPYMVMELLSGDDLAAIVERDGPLPIERAVDYVAQACDAIAEAHAHRIAHRDLKPANLFLARKKDGRKTVKVLDFGISKALVGGEDPLEGNLTQTRSVVGSPYYMSPEQVRDAKRVDTRTDIWALGMILYELLLGEPAFDAETLPGICAAIVADPPPPIRMSRPDVPVNLEGVVLRCLEKDPAQRFQTVQELLMALLPFLPASAMARISHDQGREFVISGSSLPVSFPGAPASITADRTDEAPVAKRSLLPWLALAAVVLAVAGYFAFAARAPLPAPKVAASPARVVAPSPPIEVVKAAVAPSPAPAAPAEVVAAPEPAAAPKSAADLRRPSAHKRSARSPTSAKSSDPVPAPAGPSDIRLER